jgi:prepilin-type N-terminal cleavage/methylation domain-containing protein
VQDSRGFTLVELLIVMAVVAVLLSISVASYRNARIVGAEASAIAALEAINQAQFAYMQTCGRQNFAPTLVELGTPVPGSGSAFLSPDLTYAEQVRKSGYFLQMSGTEVDIEIKACTGNKPASGYQVTADPTHPGSTGIRYFGSNVDRVLFEGFESFTGRMPEKGAPPNGRELKLPTAR